MLAFADAFARRALDSAIDLAIATNRLPVLVDRIRALDSLGVPVVLHSDVYSLGFVAFATRADGFTPIVGGLLVEFRRRAASGDA